LHADCSVKEFVVSSNPISNQSESGLGGASPPSPDQSLLAYAPLDGINVPICVLDSGARIVFANQAWRDFFEMHYPRQAGAGLGSDFLALFSKAMGEQPLGGRFIY
jgi:hypothetical protein